MDQKNSYAGRCRRGARAIACAIALCAAVPGHAESIQAIWQVQRLELHYSSTRALYSCDGLEDKIRSILLAVGAHESIAVDTRCGTGEPISSAQVLITLASPAAATEENIRAATSFEPHQRLAAQLRHVALPTPVDIERFAASWQRIPLRRYVIMSDCDLLDDLRSQIFPKLQIRGATGFTCSVSATRLRPTPRVEALVRSEFPLR